MATCLLSTVSRGSPLPCGTQQQQQQRTKGRQGRGRVSQSTASKGTLMLLLSRFLGNLLLFIVCCNKDRPGPSADEKMGRRVALAINSAIFRRSTTSLGYRRPFSCQIIRLFLPIHLLLFFTGQNPPEFADETDAILPGASHIPRRPSERRHRENKIFTVYSPTQPAVAVWLDDVFCLSLAELF